MRLAGELNGPGIPAEATLAARSGNRVFNVSRDAQGWLQREAEPGAFAEEHRLAYAIGSGANGVSFLVRREKYLFQAPLSYYSKPSKWDLSPGYEHADYGFTRPATEECLRCHSGGPRPIANRIGEYADPPFQELAIGCESCHGPGSAHAGTAGKGFITNPAKLPARLAENICMNCHQGGDARILQPGRSYADFRPGQWLIDTVAIFKAQPKPGEANDADLLEHDSAMKLSRCFRESRGKLGCLSCHDPHREPRKAEAAAYYREKCLTCHSDASCRLPLQSRAVSKPPDDCAGCHMPKRDVALISHSALTNHRIPARPGQHLPEGRGRAPESPGPADSLELIVVNQREGEVKPPALPTETLFRAYGELANRDSAFAPRYFALLDAVSRQNPEAPLVQSALGHRALGEGRNEEAVSALQKALPGGGPAPFEDLAQALANLGRTAEALEILQRGVEQNPFHAMLRKSLTLQYINLKRYREARTSMEAYVELFPADSFMRELLAEVKK